MPWLDETLRRDPADAAHLIGDALAATNRVAMSDGKRLELAEKYWSTANTLWPQLEKQFVRASHPLSGEALEAAKAALTLASELATAYKHLLFNEADKRISLGGQRLMVALVHRCLQCTARILVNSYLSYSPVPPRTWHDSHLIYMFARERGIHLTPVAADQPEATPERLTVQSLLLALANPYGFLPGQLPIVLRYVQEYAHWAKLTDVVPVHRMAKAVAIVPVGHDFPPFSANKGGSIDGSKLFLLTFDLAFQIQEQLRALEAGGDTPAGIGRDPMARLQYIGLAEAPAAAMGDSAGAAVQPAAVARARRHVLGLERRLAVQPRRACGHSQSAGRPAADGQLPGDQPHAGRLRAAPDRFGPGGAAHRRTDRAAHRRPRRPAGRDGPLVSQHLQRQRPRIRLRTCCPTVPRLPRPRWKTARQVRSRRSSCSRRTRAPDPKPAPPQILVPAGAFALEQAITLKRGNETGFAVLTKLVEQGPGFELYEFVAVG